MTDDRKPPTFVAQVGGDHYQQGVKPQHWDLAIMYLWDPFQYQITKYVMRWKDKYRGNPQKQLEDLKKARSFLDKYIANYEQYLELPHTLVIKAGDNVFSVGPTSPETVNDNPALNALGGSGRAERSASS